MNIDPTRASELGAKAAEQAAEQVGRDKRAASPAARVDQVEISAEARALQSEAEASGVESVPFTDGRVAEIRAKLDSGFYDRPDVVEETARRLVDSGDV